jgi:hypothetical protein
MVELSKGKPPVTSDSIVNLDHGVIRSITRSRYLLLLFILICIGISHCPSIDRLCARAFVVVWSHSPNGQTSLLLLLYLKATMLFVRLDTG